MLRPIILATAIGRASLAASLGLLVATATNAAANIGANPPAVVKAWRDIAKLPDWSGTWKPDISVEGSEFRKNPIPWIPKAQLQIDHLQKEYDAGRPALILWGCF